MLTGECECEPLVNREAVQIAGGLTTIVIVHDGEETPKV